MKRPRKHSRAFTLIETMVAVVLLGLLAGGVVMSLSDPIRASGRADAVDAIRSFDSHGRTAATSAGRPVRLEFDLTRSTLTRLDGPRLGDIRTRISLPHGVTIDDVRIAGQDVSAGLAVVDISPHGWSRSYQVHLHGPGTDEWISFSGLTGQSTEAADESKIPK